MGTNYACEKEKPSLVTEVPSLVTSEISNITGTSANCGGTITSEGIGTIISRGICWSTSITPTINDNKINGGAGAGTFACDISGLTESTSYFVRAYATNSSGTGYGMTMSFNTLPAATPVLSTIAVSNITLTTAASGGIITSEGTRAVTARGVCWSLNSNPTTANNKTSNGIGQGEFISNVTDLVASTTYYLRAYATNSIGTSYGDQVTFKTSTCKTCKLVTTDSSNGDVTEGFETIYCGDALIAIESKEPVRTGTRTTVYVCR